MLKYSRSKAQFFIVSTAVIISILSFVSVFLQSFHLPRFSYFSSYPEFHLIPDIKNALCEATKKRGEMSDDDFTIVLEQMKNEIERELEDNGIIFDMDYKIFSEKVYFKFNLTSAGFYSETEFYCP